MNNSKHSNILRQFRDENSDSLQKVSAVQFYEIWNHYDEDGNGCIGKKVPQNLAINSGAHDNFCLLSFIFIRNLNLSYKEL
jgi:hypothetical protein